MRAVALAILYMTNVIAIKPGGLSDVAWKAGRPMPYVNCKIRFKREKIACHHQR